MSEIKVNSIKGVSASTAAISIDNSSGTCTANITNNLSNRNLIINGAMQVAQRGTTSTADGIHTVDRFTMEYGGENETPTQSQADVASGTTPYALGFRKAFKVTNGNQTSGAGAGDYINLQTKLEAQDIANSGWNYTSSSSNITLSFWIKSSVAQTFKGFLRTRDGTEQRYAYDTGSLSADTWTKITKTISGNSNITIDNDNGEGIQINISPFWGTNFTDSGVTENTWGAYSGSTRMKDNTSTWWTTNDATLEITGVQLEVGSVATDFEHRSYGDELLRCQRYYQSAEGTSKWAWDGLYASGAGNGLSIYYTLTPEMRADPTITHNVDDKSNVTSSIISAEKDSLRVGAQTSGSGRTAMTRSGSGYIRLNAEL